MPFHFMKTGDGGLLAANGMDPVLYWDGISDQMVRAGVPKPAAAVVVGGSGVGPILGTYSAYLRYLDAKGHVSSLSPLGAEYTTVGVTASAIISGTSITLTSVYSHPNTGFTTRFFNGANIPYDPLEGYVHVVAPNHGFQANYIVVFSGVTGTTELNGAKTIARIVNQNEFIVTIRFANAWAGAGAVGRAVTVSGVANTTPIVLTSVDHGLVTGAKVKVEGIGSVDGVYPVTVLNANSFALDGSTGSSTVADEVESIEAYGSLAAVIAAAKPPQGSWTSGVSSIDYTELEAPTDSRVVRRQILRNTNGQTATYYVDIDTTDLTSTALSSTRTDEDLANQEEVALFDGNLKVLANRFDEPPTDKPFMSQSNDLAFYWGHYDYRYGNVKVTFGGTTVTGVGTEFTAALVRRFLYVVGASEGYEIESVDTVAQTLTLLKPYQGGSDNFAEYAIQSSPGERRLVYWSEPGLPAAVNPLNSLRVQESGDDATGSMVMGDSFVYLLERSHIHRVSFMTDPGVDGKIFLKANRGCVNNRCWVAVERNAFLLDEQGIHVFSGEDEHISDPIQDVFRPEWVEFKVNWSISDYFHACYFPRQGVIRWFVTMSGERLPRHAIAYEIRLGRWWIEEYPVPISASCVASNLPQATPLVGGEGRRVMALWSQPLDGVDQDEGTVRGTVTSATAAAFADTAATFSADVVGWSVTIVNGTGKGQTRLITAVDGTTVELSQPWLVTPDTTSVYQIGGVSWRWKGARQEWSRIQNNNARRLEVSFPPLEEAATFDIRVYDNYSATPVVWDADYASADRNGIKVVSQEPDLVCDLTVAEGVVQQDLSGWRDERGSGSRYVTVELRGVQGEEQVVIDGVQIEGAH